MRSIKVIAGLAVLTMMIGLQGCANTGNGKSLRSETSSDAGFEHETKTTTGEMQILPEMVRNIVTLQEMKLTNGSITITLVRPGGEVFWEKTYTAPVDSGETIVLDMDTGTWRLKMDYQDATGQFKIKWNAGN